MLRIYCVQNHNFVGNSYEICEHHEYFNVCPHTNISMKCSLNYRIMTIQLNAFFHKISIMPKIGYIVKTFIYENKTDEIFEDLID